MKHRLTGPQNQDENNDSAAIMHGLAIDPLTRTYQNYGLLGHQISLSLLMFNVYIGYNWLSIYFGHHSQLSIHFQPENLWRNGPAGVACFWPAITTSCAGAHGTCLAKSQELKVKSGETPGLLITMIQLDPIVGQPSHPD